MCFHALHCSVSEQEKLQFCRKPKWLFVALQLQRAGFWRETFRKRGRREGKVWRTPESCAPSLGTPGHCLGTPSRGRAGAGPWGAAGRLLQPALSQLLLLQEGKECGPGSQRGPLAAGRGFMPEQPPLCWPSFGEACRGFWSAPVFGGPCLSLVGVRLPAPLQPLLLPKGVRTAANLYFPGSEPPPGCSLQEGASSEAASPPQGLHSLFWRGLHCEDAFPCV